MRTTQVRQGGARRRNGIAVTSDNAAWRRVGPGSGRERRIFRSTDGKTRVTFRDRSLAGEPVIRAFSFGHSGPTEIEVPSNRPVLRGSRSGFTVVPGCTEVLPVRYGRMPTRFYAGSDFVRCVERRSRLLSPAFACDRPP